MYYKDRPEKDLIMQVERLFKKADQDGNGYIDYSEWQMATIDRFTLM
jgi:hypothetical protein